jgi:transposase
MKLLSLTMEEQRTLRDMGIYHCHPRTRMRAQGLLRLNEGRTLQQTADEFTVHLNSVERWHQQWKKFGLSGLYERHRTGRRPKWSQEQREALRDLAESEGGTAGSLLRQMVDIQAQRRISVSTAKHYLKQMGFRYKRSRYSLKKSATKRHSMPPKA